MQRRGRPEDRSSRSRNRASSGASADLFAFRRPVTRLDLADPVTSRSMRRTVQNMSFESWDMDGGSDGRGRSGARGATMSVGRSVSFSVGRDGRNLAFSVGRDGRDGGGGSGGSVGRSLVRDPSQTRSEQRGARLIRSRQSLARARELNLSRLGSLGRLVSSRVADAGGPGGLGPDGQGENPHGVSHRSLKGDASAAEQDASGGGGGGGDENGMPHLRSPSKARPGSIVSHPTRSGLPTVLPGSAQAPTGGAQGASPAAGSAATSIDRGVGGVGGDGGGCGAESALQQRSEAITAAHAAASSARAAARSAADLAVGRALLERAGLAQGEIEVRAEARRGAAENAACNAAQSAMGTDRVNRLQQPAERAPAPVIIEGVPMVVA